MGQEGGKPFLPVPGCRPVNRRWLALICARGSSGMAADTQVIQTVRQLTDSLRRHLERQFPFVWVRGEVGNISRPASGHLYFTLKDADAQLQCVWFRGSQRQHSRFDPLTGEVFETPPPAPEVLVRQGAEIVCAGHVGVYAPRGQYQLVVELAQPFGQGGLALAFEERKRQLAARGYFAQERKRPLPWNPRRVALVTSPSGAAIHDFWRIASRRGSGARICLFPSLVQGAAAAPSLVAALEAANALAGHPDGPQVIVLVRGGGSLEDLWAFNEQMVADAVFRSRLPVLAGIGHEVDVTLADMTADVRAATPSHAAQLLWPSRQELMQRLDDVELSLHRAQRRCVERWELLHAQYARMLRGNGPARQLRRLDDELSRLVQALRRGGQQWLAGQERARATLAGGLAAHWSAARLMAHEVALRHETQRLHAALPRLLAGCEQTRLWHRQRLDANALGLVRRAEEELDRLTLRLAACDPLRPLERGYAMMQDEAGRVLSDLASVHAGQDVRIRLRDGSLGATVRWIRPRTDGKETS